MDIKEHNSIDRVALLAGVPTRTLIEHRKEGKIPRPDSWEQGVLGYSRGAAETIIDLMRGPTSDAKGEETPATNHECTSEGGLAVGGSAEVDFTPSEEE